MEEFGKLFALRTKDVLTCQGALCAYVLSCQFVLHTQVLTCQDTLHPYVLMCQWVLCAYVLTCQHVLCAYVCTCQRALLAYVPEYFAYLCIKTWENVQCILVLKFSPDLSFLIFTSFNKMPLMLLVKLF